MNRFIAIFMLLLAGHPSLGLGLQAGELPEVTPPDFATVHTILRRYCSGCHNASDSEGDFSVADYASLAAGTPEGPVILPGKPAESRLLRLIQGAEPAMPPEDEAQPTASEIAIIRQWVQAGAPEPIAKAGSMLLDSPSARPAQAQFVGAACGLENDQLVLGTWATVTRLRPSSDVPLWQVSDLPGKVNSIRAAADGSRLIVGSGGVGAFGEVVVLETATGEILQRLKGHTDAVYCASMSRDGRYIASGSYDKTVILWDVSSGEPLHQLRGHNGPIYDLDFSPDSQALVTASGDQTVKLWRVSTGQRLDTFSQPEGEMLSVRFSQQGDSVYAGGADRQIRKWRIGSTQEPSRNPMLYARFAHQRSVLQLEFASDDLLLSASDDGTVKLWRAEDLIPLGQVLELGDVPVAVTKHGDTSNCAVIELTGTRHALPYHELKTLLEGAGGQPDPSRAAVAVTQPAKLGSTADAGLNAFSETEPNDTPGQAMDVRLPAKLSGRIESTRQSTLATGNLFDPTTMGDEDYYRFSAVAGEHWIFEVNAQQSNSKLDSWIEILDSSGKSVLQTRLQAVRESYFTFRGKDSDTSDDFRLHKWEDMELDEYLYSSGEVNRLWLYPRGPDSGFKVYPGRGKRQPSFDTTASSHALGEPTYIVRELAADENPLPNGLPVFPIYFENDDDSLRRIGKDSRLNFVAARDGTYILRIRDARGFAGKDFQYEVEIRRPQPDFALEISGEKMLMPVGSGRQWSVEVTRMDGLDGAIEIDLQGLPPGFVATNPLIIEAGQIRAEGAIFATEAVRPPDAPEGDSQIEASEAAPNPKFGVDLIARCRVGETEIIHQFEQRLQIELVETPEVQLRLVDSQDSATAISELAIFPGQTISARLVVSRNGNQGNISFGKEDAGRNLPHGAFVDNIGLNGLLIPSGESQREFFITAAPKLRPGRWQFHLKTDAKGNATSRPIWLNVMDLPSVASVRESVGQ